MRKGDQIGDYVVLDKLGEGGMAHIYLANKMGAGGFRTRVVLKLALSEHPVFKEHFTSEARIGSFFNHVNIVRIIDLFEHTDLDGERRFYMVQEYVDGGDVDRLTMAYQKEHVEQPLLPVDWSVYIVCSALAGLEHAHNARMDNGQPGELVHRDLSLDNLFLSLDGDVKVGDFGIAKANITGRKKTIHGGYKGKPNYSAPEQLETRASDVDRRADIYSMGVILYELLTGQVPFANNDSRVLAIQLREGATAPAIQTLNGKVSPELAAVVSRMLQWDPLRRPQAAKEAAKELRTALLTCVPHGLTSTKDEIATFLEQQSAKKSARASVEIAPALQAQSSIPVEIADRPTAREISSAPVAVTGREDSAPQAVVSDYNRRQLDSPYAAPSASTPAAPAGAGFAANSSDSVPPVHFHPTVPISTEHSKRAILQGKRSERRRRRRMVLVVAVATVVAGGITSIALVATRAKAPQAEFVPDSPTPTPPPVGVPTPAPMPAPPNPAETAPPPPPAALANEDSPHRPRPKPSSQATVLDVSGTGATVLLDEHSIGPSPIKGYALWPGPHTLELRLADGTSHRSTFSIESGRSHRIRVPSSKPTEAASPPSREKASTLSPADAKALFDKAQESYVHGQYERSRDLANECVAGSPRSSDSAARCWRIVGAASCFLKDVPTAMKAYGIGDQRAKDYLHYVCQRNSVELKAP